MLVEDHLRLQSKLHHGKTTLTWHMIAVARTLEENVVLLEAEHTFDSAYPKPLCGDVKRLIICQPDKEEMAFELADSLCRFGAIHQICVDSVLALTPRAEIEDPLLVEAAREDPVNQPPAWMMRLVGRNMAAYRKLAEKYPSFRERSKIIDLIVEIPLQPWAAFCLDGVIIFSDILTPLPTFGVPFDIEEVRGPVIHSTLCTENELKALHSINFEKLHFVGESLRILLHEVGEQATVFGFVSAPWTIAAYIVEGGSTRTIHCDKEDVPYRTSCIKATFLAFNGGNF
ncbi:hypothetical protein Nepgr_021236 [Nepenthes gracilis]|uniref:Uroporphyrinogen decarboxylase (URO-D) domain-containing protein n=1 Tax=Nepenthes gracilis TaxID=150966 RepID=A0AAD3XX15_NEPGR|nr:hypothetical protein Nepgr_021236 [Nepenthes gracilis]